MLLSISTSTNNLHCFQWSCDSVKGLKWLWNKFVILCQWQPWLSPVIALFQKTLTSMCIIFMNLKLCLITTLHLLCFQEPLLFKENVAHVSGGARFFNATFQVAACTVVGCGPLSQPVLILPASGKPDKHLANLLFWHYRLSSIW